jgi:hypothetical protein
MKKINILLAVCVFIATSASAQWSIDSLSSAYSGLAVTQNGSKVIFASSTKFELYDFATNTWSTKSMLQPRPNVIAATINGVSYFGGGGFINVSSYNFFKNVDIYREATNTWSTSSLSTARIVGGIAAVGNKVLFAGGRQILNYSNRVDLFDVTTGIRTTHNLSQGRSGMAVAVVGSKVIFAGGECGSIPNGIYTESNKVDIYDDATGLWSTALLSMKRQRIAVAVVGTKVLFAGGLAPSGNSKRIDIYDASTNTWSTMNMSQGKYGIAAATVGNKVYFAGGAIGSGGTLSNRVEIYDATTNSLSYVTLSSPRMYMAVAQTSQHLLFAGGIVTWGNVGTDRVEVLDVATNTWSVEYLSRPRMNLATASYGGTAMFAGGAEVLSSYPQYSILSKRVDFRTDVVLRDPLTVESSLNATAETFTVYPNPASDQITISSSDEFEEIRIYHVSGKLIYKSDLSWSREFVIGTSTFPAGAYIVSTLKNNNVVASKRMFVIH